MNTQEQNIAEFADLLRSMTDEQFASLLQAVAGDLAKLELRPKNHFTSCNIP